MFCLHHQQHACSCPAHQRAALPAAPETLYSVLLLRTWHSSSMDLGSRVQRDSFTHAAQLGSRSIHALSCCTTRTCSLVSAWIVLRSSSHVLQVALHSWYFTDTLLHSLHDSHGQQTQEHGLERQQQPAGTDQAGSSYAAEPIAIPVDSQTVNSCSRAGAAAEGRG